MYIVDILRMFTVEIESASNTVMIVITYFY